jgi:hypothetical protein
MAKLRVIWREHPDQSAGRAFPFDPGYPNGTALDLTLGANPACWAPLPYPGRPSAFTWCNTPSAVWR